MLIILAVPLVAPLLCRLKAWAIPLILLYYYSDAPMLYLHKNGVCFFCLGAVLGQLRSDLRVPALIRPGGLVVLWIGLALVYTVLSLYTEWRLELLFKTLVLAGIAGLVAIYDLAGPRVQDWLWQFTPNRFFIYMGFDPFLTICLDAYLARVQASQWTRLAGYLLMPILVIAVCMVAARFLRRRSEKFYDFITGGR